MPTVFNSRQRKRDLFLLGALLGVLVFLLAFGLTPLDVTNDLFCRGGYLEKDIQQHYAGWLFYRQSPLQFPLCIAQGINAPTGLSVAYTDSIPLVAALARMAGPLLPATFQYFGWFTLLCFALQGGFGALLCGLFAEDMLRPLLGCMLFLASPVLWERAFRHTSLAAQWLVLAALYSYFTLQRKDRYAGAGLFLLNVAAVGIHPYFLPMTYAITFSLLVQHCIKHRKIWGPLAFLCANMAATLALGAALGLLHGSATSGGQALYGYFAMNLNALYNPVGVNGTNYSLFLPALGQTGGNYDAFAYLGLGILLALPPAIWALRRRLRGMLRRHGALALCCAVLTLFAVSHVLTLGGRTLAELPLPAALIKLCSVFRSGGRLFWPVYYLLVLLAFVGICALPTKRLPRCAAVTVLAAVQLVDLCPGFLHHREAFRQACRAEAFPTALQSDFWELAADQYTSLASMDTMQDDALHLALYAADHGMTTNDPFAARYDEADLARQRAALAQELAAGVVRADTLYLYEEEGLFLQAVEPVRENAWCGEVRSEDGSCRWYVIAPGLQNEMPDALCTRYDDAYPLRLADYTDALWNRGVLDEDRQIVCFRDSAFARRKLENARLLCTADSAYPILLVDDHDAGWLMVTLDIEDATVLWDQELTTR